MLKIKLLLLFSVIVLLSSCRTTTDAYVMQRYSTSFGNPSSFQILLIYENTKYEILNVSSSLKYITKWDFGNCEMHADTLALEYPNYTIEYLKDKIDKKNMIYPILNLLDSTEVVNKKIS